MLPVPTPIASHVVVPIPNTTEIEEPPCSYTLCGRVKAGVIDGMLTVCEIYTAVSSVSFGVSGNYPSCVVFGIATLACGISHGLYRKFGNISAIVDQFKAAQRIFQTTASAFTEEQTQLQSALTQSAQLTASLENRATALEESSQKLDDELTQNKAALESLLQINRDLKLLNEKLQSDVETLTKINASIKDRIREFSSQNKEFKQGLAKIDMLLPHLKEADSTIERLDQQFDQDLDDLELEMTRTRSFIKKIIDAFQKENEEILFELTALKQSDKILESDLNKIDANSEQYRALLKDYEKARSELEQIKAQIDTSVLDNEIQALSDTLDRLQKQREALEASLKEETTGNLAE